MVMGLSGNASQAQDHGSLLFLFLRHQSCSIPPPSRPTLGKFDQQTDRTMDIQKHDTLTVIEVICFTPMGKMIRRW